MQIWSAMMRWLQPSETRIDQSFSLGNRGEQPAAERAAPSHSARARTLAKNVITHIDSVLEAAPQGRKALAKAGDLSDSLDENVSRLKALFRMPTNKDLVIRPLEIATQPPVRAVICFMEGLSDKVVQNDTILEPLMLFTPSGPFSLEALMERLLPGNQVTQKHDFATIADALLAGDTVVMAEGERSALAVESKDFPVRSIGEPQVEQVVWGPRDAFTEAWRINVALVRRRLKDPRVVTEILTVGEIGKTYVGMMYIDGIVAPKLVAEVKRRVESLKVDAVAGSGMLEQYIEDNPGSLFPGTLSTERPDRTAAYLTEGHIALLMDNSAHAIICPVTLFALLQSPEDYYLRWPFGTFVRILRTAALIISLVIPAVYLAVVNFHQEMVPTELMLFIAATRENVPMPALFEILAMDLTFELIREAGIRIPTVIGPTLGLVASLVLGQAAVAAKVVSPLMIIVIAIAGLASFAIPTYLTGFGVRLLRFALLGAAGFLGFYGMGAAVFLIVVHLSAMRSFGVPYLSPLAPRRSPVTDLLRRPHLFAMELRPAYTRPLDRRRQAGLVRKWDPNAPALKEAGQKEEAPTL